MSGERPNTDGSSGGIGGVSALSERESGAGWRFDLSVPREDADEPRTITLALSWVDYEYWSHGAASPCRVAEAVVCALIEGDPARTLPEEFDASTARRWVRDLDRRVREIL